MVHVPYQGSPQAVTDLLAGRIHLMFSPAAAVLPHIQSGALKALASTPSKRPSAAPDLPTMIEAGVNLDASLWFAIWAPSGTPKDVIDTLSRSGNEAINTPEARTIFSTQGFDAIGGTPEEFALIQAKELAKWQSAVDATGIRK